VIVTTPDATRAQEGGSSKFRRMVRWMFVNRRKGGITVAQWPNVASSVFIALSVARRLNIAKGTPQTTLRLLSVVAILVWAADELIRESVLSAGFSAWARAATRLLDQAATAVRLFRRAHNRKI